MTDAGEEGPAIKAVWPEVQLLLCVFHILQAVWKWLKGRKLARDVRLHLLQAFSRVLFHRSSADDEAGMFVDLHARVQVFLADPVVALHPGFVEYLRLHYALDLLDKDKAKRIYTCFRAFLGSPDRQVFRWGRVWGKWGELAGHDNV